MCNRGILISAHLPYTQWFPLITAAREWEASLWSSTLWICWATHMAKDWTTALVLPFSEAAFYFQQCWPHFRSKERRGYGVNLLTGCLRSQHHTDTSSGEGPAACGTPLHSHTQTMGFSSGACVGRGLAEWSSFRNPCAQSLCISGIFLPLEKTHITEEAVCCQTFHMCCSEAQPSTRLNVTLSDDYSDNSHRNFLVWANSLYRWEYG